jgi:MFS family permease
MSASPSPLKATPSPSHNLRVLALRNFLFGTRRNMVGAVWQPFVLHLGASMSLLGLLESIGGFQGIVSTAMLPLGGWLSDRRGRKPFVVLASGLGLATLASFALAGWVREWRLLIPGVILMGLTAIARPVVDSITAESAASDAQGSAFSLTVMGFAVSGVFAPTLGGFLADRYGFLAVLLAGLAMELITLCVMSLALTETLAPEHRAVARLSELPALLRRVITPPARLRSFYIAVAIDMFAFGTGSAILFGLLSKEYGFSPLQLGLMSSAQSVTWAVLQLFAGRQVDKRGCVPFLVLSEAIAAVVTAGWLLAKSFTAFLALHALLGFAVATWVPAFMAWIANSVPEGQRAEEIGRLGAFRGLLSFPAPYVGGLLYEVVGFRGPVLANLIGAAIVTVLLWRFVGEPPRASGDARP